MKLSIVSTLPPLPQVQPGLAFFSQMLRPEAVARVNTGRAALAETLCENTPCSPRMAGCAPEVTQPASHAAALHQQSDREEFPSSVL